MTVQQFHGRYVLQVRRELKRRPARRPWQRVVSAGAQGAPEKGSERPAADRGAGPGGEATAPTPSGVEERTAEKDADAGSAAAVAPGVDETVTSDVEGASLLDRIVHRSSRKPMQRSRPVPPPPDPAPARTSLVERSRPLVEVDQPPEDPRAAARTLFYRFALEFEMAESRQDLVDVVAGVDRYVDEALALWPVGQSISDVR